MPDALGAPTGQALRQSFERELKAIIRSKPIYVWGGCESESKGLDCSGYIFLAAKRSGLLVKRVTAFEMEAGRGGWDCVNIGKLRDADDCDLVWWTWRDKPNRPHGHVGAFILGFKSGLLEVTHASSAQKHVVCEPLKGKLETEISSIKRLRVFK